MRLQKQRLARHQTTREANKMAGRRLTLDERIEKAEKNVRVAKERYDAALDNLERLVTKRKEIDDKSFSKHIIRATKRLMKS